MGIPRLPLRWRVFMINAALLVLATLLLAFTPFTLHAPIRLTEGLILVVAFGVLVGSNLLLLGPAFASLDRLVRRMQTVDLLRPGQRLAEGGGVEVGELVKGFNEMLARLEEERRESGRRALAAQEGERLRIARGLHDEVGQVLTGVLLQLDSLADANVDPQQRRADLRETKQAVRQALEEVRRIAQELRPETLEHFGLVSALTELSGKFTKVSGLAVERHLEVELPHLSRETELAIYRVAQESLTNVARHACASRVELSLEGGVDSVVLRVIDDGRGLDEEILLKGHGGLRGMRERAVLAGGALAIKPGPGGGIEIRLEVPAESH